MTLSFAKPPLNDQSRFVDAIPESLASSDVAVVIPLHNKAAYIARTLNSVLAQTHPPREIIVVDDGSSDGGIDVIRDWMAEHFEQLRTARIQLQIFQQSQTGPGAARNRGAQMAMSPLLVFLDADDEWMPTFLDRGNRGIGSLSGLYAGFLWSVSWRGAGEFVAAFQGSGYYGGALAVVPGPGSPTDEADGGLYLFGSDGGSSHGGGGVGGLLFPGGLYLWRGYLFLAAGGVELFGLSRPDAADVVPHGMFGTGDVESSGTDQSNLTESGAAAESLS